MNLFDEDFYDESPLNDACKLDDVIMDGNDVLGGLSDARLEPKDESLDRVIPDALRPDNILVDSQLPAYVEGVERQSAGCEFNRFGGAEYSSMG